MLKRLNHFMRFIIVLFIFIQFNAFAQDVIVSPQQLVFGPVTEISPDSQQISITNNSPYDITVTEYRFFNTYSLPAFSTSAGVQIIPTGSTSDIWIKFSPRHNIYHESELIIKHNGGSGQLRVDLEGQGRYSDSYYTQSENLSEENLKTELKNIISANYNSLGYSQARDEMYMVIDNKKVNGQGAPVNTLECVYTGREAVGYTSRTDCQTNDNFNTEHTFPQGFFSSSEPERSDLFHIFPTDDNANNTRGSNPFGIVNNPSWSQGGSKSNSSTFEPRNEQKGVSARAMMYFVTRYQDYTNFFTSQENILRQWHDQYPPDAIEKARCASIYTFQNNRNPFIDYPQFTERIRTFSSFSSALPYVEMYASTDTVNFGFKDASVANIYTLWIVNNGNQVMNISSLGLNPSVLTFINGTGSNMSVPPGEAIPLTLELANALPGQINGTLTFNAVSGSSNTQVTIPVAANLSLTGISENTRGNINVYPNPVEDMFCMDTPLLNAEISVYGIAGNFIGNISNVNCSDILKDKSSGPYILLVHDQSGLHRSLVIKK